MTEHSHHHHHHGEVTEKSVKLLILSFAINMLLSVAEIVGGILSGSIALIGDALHNTSDALSILIAVIAFKIGNKKASGKYTYGFKRAEVVGGFVNLILLFVSGCYLLVEGVFRLIKPEPIEGMLIIGISVAALIIDAATAKISHHDADHNTNMKMVFVHNLADMFGSVGVIVSGVCVLRFGLFRIDGVVAVLIAAYMIVQSIISFPQIVNILMNAAPDHIDLEAVRNEILQIKNVRGVHHIHLWCVSEHETALECHIESDDTDIIPQISETLKDKFGIGHCNIQIEKQACKEGCDL